VINGNKDVSPIKEASMDHLNPVSRLDNTMEESFGVGSNEKPSIRSRPRRDQGSESVDPTFRAFENISAHESGEPNEKINKLKIRCDHKVCMNFIVLIHLPKVGSSSF